MSSPFPVAFVAGVPFQATTLERAIAWIIGVAAREHISVNVRLANSWSLALASRDERYHDLLAAQGINFPDGAPVARFMNLGRRNTIAERVRGPSLFCGVMQAGVGQGVRHFLLGGSPVTLIELRRSLERRYPGIQIVGEYSPPFAPISPEYVAQCASAVHGSGADLLWIGLGTPKQDHAGTELASTLGITTISVGAAFDFVAGTVKEAPRWVQNSGFEWLFRLIVEPRRLWRRYLIGNVEFLWAALRSFKEDRSATNAVS
ncbi:hypothetical protein A6B34_13350 [Mycolicibacterium monacense]|nr:hypothetical protein A6B34_13350 [Mycolicibacterium monacense]